jgi:hypothetical protein
MVFVMETETTEISSLRVVYGKGMTILLKQISYLSSKNAQNEKLFIERIGCEHSFWKYLLEIRMFFYGCALMRWVFVGGQIRLQELGRIEKALLPIGEKGFEGSVGSLRYDRAVSSAARCVRVAAW